MIKTSGWGYLVVMAKNAQAKAETTGTFPGATFQSAEIQGKVALSKLCIDLDKPSLSGDQHAFKQTKCPEAEGGKKAEEDEDKQEEEGSSVGKPRNEEGSGEKHDVLITQQQVSDTFEI